MSHKRFFWTNGGGATMLLLSTLFAFSALLPWQVAAQACNHWEIEICNEVKPPAAVDPTCTNPLPYSPCSAVYYYIYLSRVGQQENTNIGHEFSFSELNVSGEVLVTPSPATSRKMSKPNEAHSLSCSPSGINDPNDPSSPLYGVDEAQKNFAYKVVQTGEIFEWDVFGRRLLCVLAIDAFPGETIELDQLSATAKLSNGLVCNFIFGSCGTFQVPSYFIEPPPACTATGFHLRQSGAQNAPIAGYPNRKKIPVYVHSFPAAVYNIQQLDFLMRIEAPALMAGVSLVPGQFSAQELEVYNETNGANTNKRVYADYRNISIAAKSFPTVSNTLFYIILDGPVLSSDCGSTTVAFTENRRALFGPNGPCCKPVVLGFPQSVEWNSTPCPSQCSNLEVRAKTASNPPLDADPCHSLFFDVDLVSFNLTKTYTEGKVRVEVKHSGTITWNAAMSISHYCNDLSACVTPVQLAPGLLQLTFDIDGNTPIHLFAQDQRNLIQFGFDATDACIEAITFRDAIFTEENATVPCLPTTVSEIKNAVPADIADDICITSLTMTYELHFGPMMEEVNYRVADQEPPLLDNNPFTCERVGLSSGIGSSAICACYLPNQPQWVYPSKDDNPLNGVTTYDLVLISKHGLGIQPLDSPFKMIAADANKSGSITTFDIVELRKLILGIYSELPNNDSYRFVDKGFAFPNLGNPFQTIFPEWIQITIPPLGAVAAFKGIKIGDVNNTVVANLVSSDDRTATTMPIGFVPKSGKKGATARIPVFVQDAMDCNSWQMGIGYDPLQWKVTNVVWASQMGEMPEQVWHEASPGALRLLGYNAVGDLVRLPKGAPLFYLEGELLQDASNISLWLEDKSADFPSEAYGTNGDRAVFALRAADGAQVMPPPPASTSPPKETWSAAFYPNPAGKAFRVQLTAPEDGVGSIRFFNPLGQLVLEHSQGLTAGENVVTSANLPALRPGQYMVKIDTPWGAKSLLFVKN
ncbi:MAG: T9SS type A sorting domain-containing protein [Saprospiraceae bacterium]